MLRKVLLLTPLAALVTALLLVVVVGLAPEAGAQLPEKPQPCPGDLVLGGDAQYPPGDNVDDFAVELHVRNAADRGTWAGFTSTRPADWTAANRGQTLFAFTGDCTKLSRFSFRTFADGMDTVYTFDGDPTTVEDLETHRVGPTVKTVTGNMHEATTRYEIRNDVDQFDITFTLALHKEDRQDTFVRMSYEVCNARSGPATFGLKNFVAVQTGSAAGEIYENLYDEWGQPQETLWSDNETRLVGADLLDIAAQHYAPDDKATQLPHLFALLRDHDGVTMPFPPTTPTEFYFWDEADLRADFGPPTGSPSQLDNGAIAWYWGVNASTAMQVGSAQQGGEACWTGHAYIGVAQNAIVPERTKPADQDPVPVLGVDASHTTCQDSAVRFSAWGSTDAEDGLPSRIRWDFGDGTTWPANGATGPYIDVNINRTKTYADPGVYKVQLRVYDEKFNVGFDEQEIEVVGDPNCPPVIEAVPAADAEPDRPFQLQLNVTDHEDDRLRFYLVDSPPFLQVHPRSGIVSGMMPREAGSYLYEVCVTDERSDPLCFETLLRVGEPGAESKLRDRDHDGIIDESDNCYLIPNRDQADRDGDGIGDACDTADPDQDVPSRASPDEGDRIRCDGDQDIALDGDMDGDGIADPCDLDLDGDGVLERGSPFVDNCPFVSNPSQADRDDDDIGDACDGTDGLGYATASQESGAIVCMGCPEVEGVAPATTRLESRSIGMMAVGLGIGMVGAAVAGVFLLRRQ